MIIELDGILEARVKYLQNMQICHYKIKWKGLPVDDATWETTVFTTASTLVKTYGRYPYGASSKIEKIPFLFHAL